MHGGPAGRWWGVLGLLGMLAALTACKPFVLIAGGSDCEDTELAIDADNLTIAGNVHSNGELTFDATGTLAGKVTGVGTIDTGAVVLDPAANNPQTTGPKDYTFLPAIADYRPGGSIAVAAGTTYHDHSGTALTYLTGDLEGIYYTDGSFVVTGSGRAGATFVAENTITILDGHLHRPATADPNGLLAYSNSNAGCDGDGVHLVLGCQGNPHYGLITAPNAGVRISADLDSAPGDHVGRILAHQITIDAPAYSLSSGVAPAEPFEAVGCPLSNLPMGSDSNTLGNDPVEDDLALTWLVTFGTNGSKPQGDRYHVRSCTGALVGCAGDTNIEFRSEGYFFTVGVPGPTGQDLHIQAYDPWFYDHNNNCGQSWLPTTAQVNGTDPYWSSNFAGQPVDRFQRGANFWCSGDSNGVGGVNEIGASNEQGFTAIVRAPSADPDEPTSGPIVCAATYEQVDVIDGPTDGNSTSSDYQDFKDLLSGITSNATNHDNDYGPTVHVQNGGTVDTNHSFERAWRRWVDVCEIPSEAVVPGDYIVQIRTNADPADPGGPEGVTTHVGNNRYSLRAGFDNGTLDVTGSTRVDASGVTLSARNRLPLFINVGTTGTPVPFRLARVTPALAGRTIAFDFYDIADGNTVSSLDVQPPGDAVHDPGTGPEPLGAFPDCTMQRVADSGPVELTYDGTAMGRVAGTTCALRADTGLGNGYVFRVFVDLPATYDCDVTDPTGCWVTAEITYSGYSPQDTTTWSATVVASP